MTDEKESTPEKPIDFTPANHYFFHGRVIPDRVQFWLNYRDIPVQIFENRIKFTIVGHGSEFNGTMATEKPVQPMEIFSIGKALIRSILDRHSYANICAYDFDLIGAVELGGQNHIFGVSEPVFFDSPDAQLEFSKKEIPFLPELLALSFHTVRLDHALRCFSHALRDNAMTPLFAYLAIETAARGVLEAARKREVPDIRAQEWVEFRTLLRIKQATIQNDVKALSDKFRHGNFSDTTWETRKKALAVAWEIIRRAMVFSRDPEAFDAEQFSEL